MAKTVDTLSDLVFHVREIASGRPELLSMRREGRREALSTADFLRSVHSLALALEARGLETGDRVAILSENRPEWHIVDFACQLLGVATVPLHPDSTREQVGFALRNSASRWVFYSDAVKRDLLQGLDSTLTSPPEIAAFDGGAASGGPSITRLMGEGASRLGDVPIERFRGRVEPGSPASLLYSFGSSGEPEGIPVSQGELISDMLARDERLGLSSADLAFSLASLAGSLQRTVDHLCFYRGAEIRYLSSIDEVPEALSRERPTVLTAVPAVYERSYESINETEQRENLLRRRLFSWGVAVARRHAAASRGGFVGPQLAMQRKLAELLIFRGLRRRFGGRLRLAICGDGELAPEVHNAFAAWGLPILSEPSEPPP